MMSLNQLKEEEKKSEKPKIDLVALFKKKSAQLEE
jgi:hypothetical protein